METNLQKNGTRLETTMRPLTTTRNITSTTNDSNEAQTQITSDNKFGVNVRDMSLQFPHVTTNGMVNTRSSNNSHESSTKRQRLESLHSKSSTQAPWNRGVVNGFSSSKLPSNPPETKSLIEIISISDDDSISDSSDDGIEILDVRKVTKESLKNTSFDRLHASPLQKQDLVSGLTKIQETQPKSELLQNMSNLDVGTNNTESFAGPNQLRFEGSSHHFGDSNVMYQPQGPNYPIPGSFPEQSQPGLKKNFEDDDEVEVISSRIVPPNQNDPYPLFNTPAPVPHVGDMNMDNLKKQELLNRQQNKRVELYQWEQQQMKVAREISLAKSNYDKYRLNIEKLGTALQQAVDLGKNSEANKIRRIIDSQTDMLKAPKNKINHGQQLLMKIEQAIQITRNELQLIAINLGQLGRRAMFNPYEAQIFNESISRTGPGVPAVDDVDLKNLIDNIRPDEDLQDGLEATPPELSVNLLKHQKMGLTWMKRMEASRSKGGILADDMGLGKTIQTLSLMMANRSKQEDCKSNLIVAPVSLLYQWSAEIDSKINPQINLNVGIYHGDGKRKMSNFALMKQYDVVLVSYLTLLLEWKKHFKEEIEANKEENSTFMPAFGSGGKSYSSPFFTKESNFYRIILDEAQAIKNKRGIASKSVTCLKSKYRFCLTGTPMQNNIEELYPIIRFLKIQPYCVEEKFRSDIIIPIKSKTDLYDEYDMKQSMKKLRALLKAILLRRTKDSLIDGKPILNLPAKHVVSEFVVLETEELEYYQSIEEGIQKVARKMLASNIRSGGILTLLLRLRQACCHSYLVEIGQYKAKVKRDDEASGKLNVSVKQMSNNTFNIKEEIKHRVLELSNTETSDNQVQKDEDTISCPVCFDALDFESPILIFGECGHMLCKSCGPQFFQEGDEEENLNNRSGECLDCKKRVKEQNLLEYILFQKVHIEKLNRPQFQKFCYDYYEAKAKSNQTLIREFVIRDEGFEPSAKIQKCIELIREISQKNPNEKVIVFSQFTTLFDLLKLVLNSEKIPFLRYDGTMNVESKDAVIKGFYRSDTNVLLLSLRSGNAGLTLTCANHVIIMDPFWNPYVEEQAIGRAHRIGQEREVNIHRVLIQGTVESRIMELQQHKQELIGEALDESKMKSISQLDRSELGFLFGLNSLT